MTKFERDQAIQDYEANVFAACLLIPKNLLLQELRHIGGIDLTDDKKLNRLCKKFGVTNSAMAFRFLLLDEKDWLTIPK